MCVCVLGKMSSCVVDLSPSVGVTVQCRISFISPLWVWLGRSWSQLLGLEWAGGGGVLFISGQEVLYGEIG